MTAFRGANLNYTKMAQKTILTQKEVTTHLINVIKEAAKYDLEKRYIPLAKKWLKEGATLSLRGCDFVFTLPNGEAAIHFEPWTIPSSEGCLYTTLKFDFNLGRRVSVKEPIPPQFMKGLNASRCSWEVARNEAIREALLVILKPFIR